MNLKKWGFIFIYTFVFILVFYGGSIIMSSIKNNDKYYYSSINNRVDMHPLDSLRFKFS